MKDERQRVPDTRLKNMALGALLQTIRLPTAITKKHPYSTHDEGQEGMLL